MLGMKAGPFDKLEFEQIKAFLIKEAQTQPGQEKIKRLTPFFTLSEVQREVSKVGEMAQVISAKGKLPLPPLESLAFLREVKSGQYLKPDELNTVKTYIHTLFTLRSHLKGLSLPLLKAQITQIPDLKPLLSRLEKILTPDGEGICDQASPALHTIRKRIGAVQKALKEELSKVLREAARRGFLQEEIVTQRRGRYVIPVKAEAKHRVPGILHDTSSSGATVYIEPATIIPLANRLEALFLEEKREVVRILTQVTREILAHKDGLFLLEESIAELDSLQARVLFGERINGSLPALVEDGGFKLLNAVHPLLLLSGCPVVHNDFIFPSDKPVVIISGPNLGGKTVSLKTIGLLCLMVQSGIPIPASPDSRVPVFEKILVDIGDEQDISRKESTFSAHIKRLKEIIEQAGPRRLFLIDEIGRGTDPSEGAALGMAVLEYLLGTGARVLATTHYEALKAFSFNQPNVLPLSVAFDKHTGQPTYKLTYGVAGSSYGLSLACNLGLPREIILRAEDFLGRGDQAFKEVLRSLQAALADLERQRRLLGERERQLEGEKLRLRRELEAEKERLAQRKKELETYFLRRLEEFEARFRQIIQEVKSSQKGVRKAQEEFWRSVRDERSSILIEEESSGPLQPGVRVKLRGMGQEGRVLKVKGKVAEVQLGPFKVEIATKDLIVLPEEGRPSPPRVCVKAETEVPTTVNVVGFRVDEALTLLDKVIDQAFLLGKSQLTIIHGLGTGKLMRSIRNYLQEHAQVSRVRPGKTYEGGEAVTVVELACREEVK